MKNKRLLPILLFSVLALVACGTNNKSSGTAQNSGDDTSANASVSDGEETTYGVTISNKDDLTAKWYTDSNQRSLTLVLTPEANALAELTAGNLTVTSSAPTVVSVTGLAINPLAAGKATITVTYHNATDTVEVSVVDGSAKARYGTAHEGTAEDPFTNEDALIVAKHADYEQQTYYVKGIVHSFYNSPGSRTDGMVAFYLTPATEGGEKFEIYKCFKADGSALTDDDIWVGGEATAYGSFTKYNSQYETSSAVLVSCTGTKPEARKTLEKTFAEVLAVGVALDDGNSSYDYYKFQGYVTKKDGNNYYLTATKGEELVSGTSDESHGSRSIYTNGIELFNVASYAEQLLKNAKVEVTMELKNYHGTVENNGALQELTVVEAGEPWVINYQDKTVGEALTIIEGLENGATADGYYAVSGVVVAVTTAYSSQYGNISFTMGDSADATSLLTVFRATVSADVAEEIVAGANVIVKGQLQKYVKNDVVTPELINGSSVEVIPADQPATKTIEINAANLLGYTDSNVTYSADAKPVTIDDLGVTSLGCACYGDGIQMRTNSGTGTSTIYNTTAVDLNKLEFVWASSKDVSSKDYHIFVEFSNVADFSELVGTKANVKFDASTKLAEAVPSAAAKYFRITHANQGAVYIDTIKVVINEHVHEFVDETVVATEGKVGYTRGVCAADSTIRVDIRALDGTFASGSSNKSGTEEGYLKLNSNGNSISWKFDLALSEGATGAVGTLYQLGFMDAYSSNHGVQYAWTSTSGTHSPTEEGNFRVTVNGTNVDKSAYLNITAEEMTADGDEVFAESKNYSALTLLPVGQVVLNNGENNISYTRLGSYNYAISDLVMIVDEFTHTHTVAETWTNNESSHWHVCSGENCPIANYKEDEATHTFGEKYDEVASTCSVKGSYKQACSVCGYVKTVELPLAEHTWVAGTVVQNSDSKDCTPSTCSVCGKEKVSIKFIDGTSSVDTLTEGIKLTNNSTVTWKVMASKAGKATMYLAAKASRDYGFASGYGVTANGVAGTVLISSSQNYFDVGLDTTNTNSFAYAEVDLVEGENTIVFTNPTQGYRLAYGGNVDFIFA